MKKIMALFFLFFSCFNAYASEIKQIIFFGDSLSDNGNLYHAIYNILPKSPPYFKGRFTNGFTWAEHLSKYYYNKSYIDSQIYAWGGATTILHLPTLKFIAPTIFEVEVDKYLASSIFGDKSNTLFAIWIGGNDYLFYPDDEADSFTQKVIDKISSVITRLNSYGATHFLLFNMPDLSRVPLARDQKLNLDHLHALTVMHNLKLEQAVKQIQNAHPDIKISLISAYDILNDFIDHPDKYNQKYHINITNITDACWKGSVFEQNKFTMQSLNEEIKETLIARKERLHNVNTEAVSAFIMQTPSLNYTYALGKSFMLGNIPCANPNEYIFWDGMHPTATVHKVLAQIAIETLGEI